MFRSLFLIRAISLLAFLFSQGVAAEKSLIQWQSTNLQILRGAGYELLPDEEGTVVTLEHANKWRFGDFTDLLTMDDLTDRKLFMVSLRQGSASAN